VNAVILIRNANILTMAGQVHQPGYLWIDPPLIKAVGSGEPPPELLSGYDGAILDAGGGWLMPGMIDAHCHVGLFDDGLDAEGDDGNEATDPITPQLRAMDGVFQDDRCFREALEYGITCVMTGPGSANVLAGNFALLRTTGRTRADGYTADGCHESGAGRESQTGLWPQR
jgi:imidazolonepropionase-like amidohydrolase